MPRSQTGKLPFPPLEEAPVMPPLEEEIPEAPAKSLLTPVSPEKNIRPTVPLPDFKPLFGYEKDDSEKEPIKESDEPSATTAKEEIPAWIDKDDSKEAPEPAADDKSPFHPADQPVESVDLLEEEEEEDKEGNEKDKGNESGSIDARLTELEEKLSLVTEERDQARGELDTLLEKSKDTGSMPAASEEELSLAGRERDEARMEVIVLRHQLEAAEQTQRDTEAMASQLEELSHVIDERDSVRRDYAALREQFETLKLDRSRIDSSEVNAQLEEEVTQLREELANRPETETAPSNEPADVTSLRDELKKTKDEASMSNRGLALSQKALQETREALREASEGTSMSKGSLEDLKKERAGLVRQNMLLQGQNDQLTRELSATKAKLAAKGA